MKIKKIFSAVTIASLAMLMCACSKNVKKESLHNADYFDLEAISLSDYKENIRQKQIIEVASDKEYRTINNGILVLQDTDKYYFYNLKGNGEEIITVNRDEVYDYSIFNNYGVIQIRYNANEDLNYAYELYSFEGKNLFEKTYVNSFNLSQGSYTSMLIDGYKSLGIVSYIINYQEKEAGEYVSKKSTYYVVETSEFLSYDSVKEYLSEDEYYEKYGKIKEQDMDGVLVGLKGYTLRMYDNEKVGIFKKDTLVNIVSISDMNIIGNGYMLFQSVKEVSKNEEYDVFYDGEYLKVETFKMCLKDSTVSKVKNFPYLIDYVDYPFVSDEQINGYYCGIVDFSKNKNASDIDYKFALIKGNGNIIIHDGTPIFGGNIIEKDNEYYVYNDSYYSIDYTAVYDNKGNLKKLYDGIYYDDILAKSSINTMYFSNKEGQTIYVLNDYERINYAEYCGYDVLGNYVLVEINNGQIIKTNIDGYEILDNEFLSKEVDGVYSLYTLDSNITSVDFSFDTATETYYGIYNEYYCVINRDTNKVKIIYYG